MALIVATGFGLDIEANRVIAQSAINTAAPGDTVEFQAEGGVVIGKAPSSATWCLRVPADKPLTFRGLGTTVVGARGGGNPATTLLQDAAQALAQPTLWLFYLDAGSHTIGFEDIRLDGQKPDSGQRTVYGPFQDPPVLREHSVGIFANATQGLRLNRVVVSNFIGDGVQCYVGVEDIDIDHTSILWCQRDGLTFAPFSGTAAPVQRALIRRSEMIGCSNQQIDNEHGCAHGIEVDDCLFDSQHTDGYAIAAGGPGDDTPSRNWYVHDCDIIGRTYCQWLHDSTFRRNRHVFPYTTPAFDIGRSSTRVVLEDSTIRCTQTGVAGLTGISLLGTEGTGPTDVTIQRVRLEMVHPQSFGIRAQGCVSVTFANNRMIGAGSPAVGYSAMHIRATDDDRDFELAKVYGNDIDGWGQYGIRFVGNTLPGPVLAKLREAHVYDNMVRNCSVGISLNDGQSPIQRAYVHGNQTSGVVTPLHGQSGVAYLSLSRDAARRTRCYLHRNIKGI